MNQPAVPAEGTYIARMWEHPELTVSIFGMRIRTPEGGRAYTEAGIQEEMGQSLAQAEGLLNVRLLTEGEWLLSLQYWRSHEDLSRYSKRMPHMGWWKWLIEHSGPELSFYHEIYQCKAAEAVYIDTPEPLGPSAFCSTEPTEDGQGRSLERQRRFVQAAEAFTNQ